MKRPVMVKIGNNVQGSKTASCTCCNGAGK